MKQELTLPPSQSLPRLRLKKSDEKGVVNIEELEYDET